MNGVGLYSIGIRNLDVPALLRWAHDVGVPFVHLRGGPRGFDLVRRDARTLLSWRRCGEETAPVTGVTADLDLADLFTGGRRSEEQAWDTLARLADAAASLGAGWVRLLARTPLTGPIRSRVPDTALPLLIELHHPAWLAPRAIATVHELLSHSKQMRLLTDTAQLAAALSHAGEHRQPVLTWILTRTAVLHLSDNGTGLTASDRSYEIAAGAARRITAGHQIEVAAEWTGPDRSPVTCLARYKEAASWWNRLTDNP